MDAWQFSVFSYILLVTALISWGAAYGAWRRRRTRSASTLAGLLASNGLWALTEALRVSSPDALSQMRWLQLEWIPVVLSPLLWFIFVIILIGYGDWLKRRISLLLLIPPAVIYALVLTNDGHYLIWSGTRLVIIDTYRIYYAEHGPLYNPVVYYQYVLLLVAIFLLIRAIWYAHGLVRRQYAMVLFGGLVPIAGNILSLINPTFQFFDVTVVMFLISGLLYLWAIFGLRLFQIVPIARNTVIENMEDGVIVVDRAQQVVDANSSAYHFFDSSRIRPQLIGQPIQEVLPAWMQTLWTSEPVSKVLKQTTETDIAGKRAHVEMQLSTIYERRGTDLAGWVLTLRDITLEAQAAAERERLREQDLQIKLEQERIRMLAQFIEHAAHEFRTPLTVISASASTMERLESLEKRQSKGRSIQSQVQRMTALVDMLLKMVNLENNLLETLLPVNIVPVIDGACEYIVSKYPDKLTLEWKKPAAAVRILGNTEQLMDAFSQILDNAYRFTPASGMVSVRLKTEDQNVVVDIEDNGPGIPAENQERIFETFWRHDEAHSTPGFGLGLPIARKIIDLHNGTIELDSVEGRGSRFRIILPRLDSAAAAT